MLRLILLTAARLREASNMNRAELNGDDSEWLIPAKRYKGNHDHLVPMSRAARSLLADVPKIGHAGWVFTTNGDVPISGFSKGKAAFDELMLVELRKLDPAADAVAHWTPHDLRRTARSLMSRADVDPDHGERCLGHVIGGVRGVYDCYEFRDEKRRAFEALAALLGRILHPADNVRQLRPARGGGRTKQKGKQSPTVGDIDSQRAEQI
jgi:integrase